MSDPHLRVYLDKSELVHIDGRVEVFLEGAADAQSQERYQKIQQTLRAGFLENHILQCRDGIVSPDFSRLSGPQIEWLEKLVHAISSEVGRALVGLIILQLSIKAIEPRQSIRLHKAGRSQRDFSWQDGVSMRSLDKNYVTPVLRKYDLVKLNADGFMMTRSLAENYPYSWVYKAKLRGARNEWLLLVEDIEASRINTEQALLYVLSQLLNQATLFKKLAEETVIALENRLRSPLPDAKTWVVRIITRHMRDSGYAARIMEIAMHSLFQALQSVAALGSLELAPLSQMRSANKKHGNVGDVELLENGEIIESWDAKYGKTYLRDELEELIDKLLDQPALAIVGFVTSDPPDHGGELDLRIQEIEDLADLRLEIIAFSTWIDHQFNRSLVSEDILARAWLIAFTESIAQRRRWIAPIDEPCQRWLELLKILLDLV